MIWVLRAIVSLILIIFVATYAFGQTLDIENLLPEEDLNYPVGSVPLEESGLSDSGLPMPKPGSKSFGVDQLPRTQSIDSLPKATTNLNQQVQQVEPAYMSEDTPSMEEMLPAEGGFDAEMMVDKGIPSFMAEDESIEEELAVDPDYVATKGLMSPANGGFGTDLWAGTSWEQVKSFLDKVQEKGIKSSAGRRLLQRALLSEAVPPFGQEDQNWLALRIQVLHRLGLVDAAEALMHTANVTKDLIDNIPSLNKVWVENALMEGKMEEPCTYVKDQMVNADDTFWRRALLTCQVLHKDIKGLDLSLNLLSENVKAEDPHFFALIDAIRNGKNGPMLAPDHLFTPLQSVLYAYHPNLLQPNVILRLPDALLRHVANDQTLQMSVRLQAAEKLVNDYGNATDVTMLTGLYDQLTFDDEQIKSPAATDVANQTPDGSIARAFLWQVSKVSQLPSTRAMALKALWDRAEKDGLNELAGGITPELRNIRPDNNLAWFSPYVVRIALKSGNLPVAKQWWSVLKGNRSLSRDLSDKRTGLAMVFSFLDRRVDDQTVSNWWQSQSLDSKKDLIEVQRTLSLVEAFDMQINANIWMSLHQKFNDSYVEQPAGPGPLWLKMVGTSLEQGNVGQSLILLLEPLVYTSPSEMSPLGISNIVTGLRFIGLDADASSMALEATLNETAFVY